MVTGKVAIHRGADFATSTEVFSYDVSSNGALTGLASATTPNLRTAVVIEDTLGVAFDRGSTSDELFVSLDGQILNGVVVQAVTLAGTIDRTRSAAATEAFVAGVTVGVAIAS